MANPVGRPTKRTPENTDIIVRALEMGATRRASAHIAGISEDTYYRWVADDEEFRVATEQAQAKFIAAAARTIGGHAPSLLKWSMMLQRKDEQLQPVQDRVAVDLKGDVTVRWSEDVLREDEDGPVGGVQKVV